jgi:multidrug efflux pump subunit AcrA (membrane-fusion protein)
MPVVLHADALPGKTYDGQVLEVTPKGDPVARTYRVRIRLADPDAFSVGMTVDANLIIAVRERALLVPSSAVAGGSVWTIEDGRLKHRAVTVGVASAAQTEILAGLEDSATLVANPSEALREGRRAHVKSAASTAAAAVPAGR